MRYRFPLRDNSLQARPIPSQLYSFLTTQQLNNCNCISLSKVACTYMPLASIDCMIPSSAYIPNEIRNRDYKQCNDNGNDDEDDDEEAKQRQNKISTVVKTCEFLGLVVYTSCAHDPAPILQTSDGLHQGV